MRRILFCAFLAITTSAPFLSAQNLDSALATLSDLNRRGQLPQVIETANSLLASNKLAPADQGLALIYLGSAHQQRGEFTQATASYEKALAVVNTDGEHPAEYAATLATLATVYSEIGEIDTAKHLLLRSVHLFEVENDHAGAAIIWNDLATVAVEQHSRGDTHKYMAHAIAESQLANHFTPGQRAALATTQGSIAELDHDPGTAIQDYERALDLWKQTQQDQQPRVAWLYVLLGGAFLQSGDLDNARENTLRGMRGLAATSGPQSPRYLNAELAYSKILNASGSREEATALRKQAEAGLTATAHPARGEISIAALR